MECGTKEETDAMTPSDTTESSPDEGIESVLDIAEQDMDPNVQEVSICNNNNNNNNNNKEVQKRTRRRPTKSPSMMNWPAHSYSIHLP